jgi:hypothetical protein
MSVMKTLSLSALIWFVSGTVALADPLISNSDGLWSFWSSAGSSVTPTTAAVPVPEPPPAPAPVPIPQPRVASTALSPIAESAQVSTFSTPSTYTNPIPPGGRADAFLNFGNAPYAGASLMTTGTPQPWYTSPVVEKYFGGMEPNAQQQADFTRAVLDRVQQTYQLSGGLAPRLTLDPSVPTSHTMSIVSGASYPGNPNAIGITNVGNDGFGFIDKLSYGSTLDQLEWAVAHNVSHELMHAFGVGAHDDKTGNYLDSASATWDLLTNPSTKFSDQAIADIKATAFGPNTGGTSTALQLDGDLEIIAPPIPEPTTWALWGLAASAALFQRHRQRRRKTS